MTTYYLLGLVKESALATSLGSKKYDVIANDIRTRIVALYPELGYELKYKPEDHCELDRFCEYEWKCGDSVLWIRHYKMRIIFVWKKSPPKSDIQSAFEAARKEIEAVARVNTANSETDDPLGRGELVRRLTEADPCFVDGVFFYPLAELDHEYKSADFKNLGFVPLTTFFYELPDYRRMQGLGSALNLAFRFRIPRTVMRISRPCAITTRMSDYLRAELINILYEACLYSKRRLYAKPAAEAGRAAERPGQPVVPFRDRDMDEETFDKVKNSIGRSLYDAEASSSNTESASSLYRLSLIMSLGAVASILALVVFASIGEWKSWVGAIIGAWAVLVLFLGLWRR